MALPAHWVNNVSASSVSVADRGARYGDALFETIRYQDGTLQLLQGHLSRLARGLQRLSIDCPMERVDEQLRQGQVFASAAGLHDAVFRLQVSRGQGARGYLGEVGDATISLSVDALAPLDRTPKAIELMTCQTALALQPALAGIKHCNRLEQVLAARELAKAGYSEGIQCNPSGQPICAVSSNIYIVLGSEVLTPDLSDCGIEGTVREVMIDRLLPDAGLSVTVGAITPADVTAADELLLSNALAGIRAAASLDQQRFRPSQWARPLQQAFADFCETVA